MDRNRLRTVTSLFFGFVLTGVGTALLGCILPALSQQWHLPDNRAGALFAAQFLGSALGALLVIRSVRRSLLGGYLLMFASALSIAFFSDIPEVLRFLSFGLGLGLTMTATSLWVGEVYAQNRGQALSLLNAFWTIGAALCPTLASLWDHHWQPTHLFLIIGTLALCPIFILGRSTPESRSEQPTDSPGVSASLPWIALFATLGFFYVGVEASIGSWLMSYVHRLPDVSKVWAPIVTSCFWIAILTGRFLAPALLLRVSERALLSTSIALALICAAAMLATQQPFAITLTIVLAGIALGPIYPLCLSQAMRALHDPRQTKWVFAFPGVGAALLPYLTGIVSAHKDSLRAGLLVPLLALVAMVVLDRLQPVLKPAPTP